MYKDIFESTRNEAEKRNLRERTIQLYCSDVSYFLRWIKKPISELTLEDAESFLTAKRLEGRSPETIITIGLQSSSFIKRFSRSFGTMTLFLP